MDLVSQFSVDQPVGDVYAYLTSVELIPEWNRNVRSSRLRTSGPLRRGTTFEETRNTITGVRGETFEVVELEPNRRFGVVAADGSDFSWQYDLHDQGLGTLVTTRLTIPLARRMPILEPLVAPIARRRFADNMHHLQSRIAGGPGVGIDSLERVRLGDVEQWILLRGRDRSKPVVLVIGQGPGYPTINEARDMRRLLELEDDHVVVYWDQRGCGKSTTLAASSLSVRRMRDDAAELIDALCERFRKSAIHVLGYSQGGAIAALVAAAIPDRIAGLVLVNPDVRASEGDASAYAFALREATVRDNGRALRDLFRIGPPLHLEAVQFMTRARWVADFGGVRRGATYRSLMITLLRQLATSRVYSPLDLLRAIRAIPTTQDRLLPDLVEVDLFDSVPSLEVPVSVFAGRHDQVAPPELTKRYFDALVADRGKNLTWFEESAHMPQYEEPAAFRAALGTAFDGFRRAVDSNRA
jgi:pimeloyl-ACP methyl ester carboxylesterase